MIEEPYKTRRLVRGGGDGGGEGGAGVKVGGSKVLDVWGSRSTFLEMGSRMEDLGL